MPVIDSQVHIYDRNSPEYPWADTAVHVVEHTREAGVEMAPTVTGENMIRLMDQTGVDGAVLVNFGGLYGFDNRYALGVAARHPGRFAMVGRLDPLSSTLDAGVRVLAYMDYREPFLAGAFEPIFQAVQASGLALCIYAPESVRDLHRVAETYPDLQIVLDHMCLRQSPPYALEKDRFAALPDILELAQHPNIAAKLSGVATLSTTSFPFADLWPAIHRSVAAFGPERLMWGTDTTRTRLDYGDELNFIRQSDELSQSDKSLILGGALERIFKWSPRASE